jgi:uncharacterized protein YjiS (DUF1127 family)
MAKETYTMTPPARYPWIGVCGSGVCKSGAALRLPMSRLAAMLETRRQNRDRRDAFLNMLRLDDNILDDIGVTRAEVDAAARLPLHLNAADALTATARARRKG